MLKHEVLELLTAGEWGKFKREQIVKPQIRLEDNHNKVHYVVYPDKDVHDFVVRERSSRLYE